MGHLLGYARVSTTDQHPQLQVDALQRAGCYRVFVEAASGARADRPVLTHVLDRLRPGDTLVVWKLDRLGRSLRHLVDTVTGLADRGIGFRSLQEAIDTTTPGGKLVVHVFAALAEFERDRIGERTTAGLAAARARGRHGGRPSVPTGHKRQVAEEMHPSGQCTVAAIAEALGVSRASIYRHLAGDSRRPTCPSGAGCWRGSRMALTACRPSTDLQPHHGRLQLTSCRFGCPWGTVADRCLAAPQRPRMA